MSILNELRKLLGNETKTYNFDIDIDELQIKKEETLLAALSLTWDLENAEYLIREAISSIDPSNVNITTANGETALHLLAKKRGNFVQGSIYETVFQKLKANNVDFNKKDNHGETPLHVAVNYNSLYMLQLLIESGANVNLTDHQGNTPLHEAVWAKNSLYTLQLLIKSGANVNLTNNQGNTPLHMFSEYYDIYDEVKHKAIVYLIKSGAKLNIKNKQGKTAFHFLKENDTKGNLLKVIKN